MARRRHPRRWITVLFVAIALTVLGGLSWAVLVKLNQHSSDAASSPSAVAGQEATPSPVAPTGSAPQADEPSSPTLKESCEDALGASEYNALYERALAFEPIWLSGDTPEKQQGFEQFGTARFVKANAVYVDPTLKVNWPHYEVQQSTAQFSCEQQLDDSVVVGLLVSVRTYDQNGTDKVYRSDWYQSPLHTGVWVLKKGTWMIDRTE